MASVWLITCLAEFIFKPPLGQEDAVAAEQVACSGESHAERGEAPSLQGGGWDGVRVAMVGL